MTSDWMIWWDESRKAAAEIDALQARIAELESDKERLEQDLEELRQKRACEDI